MSTEIAENKNYQRELTKKALHQLIESKKDFLAGVMPRHVSSERLLRLVYVAYNSNRQIAQCTPLSVINSVVAASSLGLEFNTPLGHGWLIPRWSGKTKRYECNFQPGYRGLVDLAYRSEKVTSVAADLVREGDEFEHYEGSEPRIVHRRALKGDRGNWYAAYAVVHVKDGPPLLYVMRRDEIEEIRDKHAPRMKGKGGEPGPIVGPWVSHPEAMARKVPISRCLKLAPISTELKLAIGLDDEAQAEQGQTAFITPEDFEDTGVDVKRLQEGGAEGIEPGSGSEEERERVKERKLILGQFGELLRKLREVEPRVGAADEAYYRALGSHGVESPEQFTDTKQAAPCCNELLQVLREWNKDEKPEHAAKTAEQLWPHGDPA